MHPTFQGLGTGVAPAVPPEPPPHHKRGNTHRRSDPIRRLYALLCLGVTACTAPEITLDATVACENPVVTGTLPPILDEASGLAISRRYRGVLWTHNDSDNAASIFAIDSTGRVLAEVATPGATNRDWEDIAIARCSSGYCFYIADIGDNLHQRNDVAIYRLPEPAPRAGRASRATRFPFRYPDQPQDAEAFFVLPDERVYIISKGRNGPVRIYRYPGQLRAHETVTLEAVQDLTTTFVQLPAMVTGASATVDSGWIAVRTYRHMNFYRPDADTFAAALAGVGIDLTALDEFQGEAVALHEDGRVYLAGEHGLAVRPARLSLFRCRLP